MQNVIPNLVIRRLVVTDFRITISDLCSTPSFAHNMSTLRGFVIEFYPKSIVSFITGPKAEILMVNPYDAMINYHNFPKVLYCLVTRA